MLSNTFTKDPGDTLDYVIDHETWLDGDTILTSSWEAESGITIESHTNTTTRAVVWLSGGAVGEMYTVVNTITTDQGRTKERSIYIICREE